MVALSPSRSSSCHLATTVRLLLELIASVPFCDMFCIRSSRVPFQFCIC